MNTRHIHQETIKGFLLINHLLILFLFLKSIVRRVLLAVTCSLLSQIPWRLHAALHSLSQASLQFLSSTTGERRTRHQAPSMYCYKYTYCSEFEVSVLVEYIGVVLAARENHSTTRGVFRGKGRPQSHLLQLVCVCVGGGGGGGGGGMCLSP